MKRTMRKSQTYDMVIQVVRASPFLFFCNYLAAALNGFLSARAVIRLQEIFDLISWKLKMRDSNIGEIVGMVLLLLAIRAGAEISIAVYNILGEVLSLISLRQMGGVINQKNCRLEPVDYEDSQKLDLIESAYHGSGLGRNFVNAAATILFLDLPYYGTLGRFLFGVKPVFLLIIVFLLIPALLIEVFESKYYMELEQESASLRRKMNCYADYAAGKETVQETRQLAAVPLFLEKYKRTVGQLTEKEAAVERRNAGISAALKLFHYAGYAAALSLLGFCLYRGEVTVGLFASVFCSLDTMFSMMQDTIHENVATAIRLYGKLSGYFKYRRLPEKREGLRTCGHESVLAEGVFFTYPEADAPALKGVDLKIEKGETVVVVGENGSGKTTLVRLLAGIYLPQKGTVSHNGIDLAGCSRKNNYQGISGVFQRFGRYQMTLEENVRLADMEGAKTAGRAETSLKRAGFEADLFPEGLLTTLGKEFGGTELSGGQWQRIAIARGLYRDYQMIFLDEPTASIDPKEEKRIFDEFERLTRDKTAVIVTHRLGTVKMADKIVVMEKGRIIAAGKHDELLEICPVYKKMWFLQKNQYEGGNNI